VFFGACDAVTEAIGFADACFVCPRFLILFSECRSTATIDNATSRYHTRPLSEIQEDTTMSISPNLFDELVNFAKTAPTGTQKALTHVIAARLGVFVGDYSAEGSSAEHYYAGRLDYSGRTKTLTQSIAPRFHGILTDNAQGHAALTIFLVNPVVIDVSLASVAAPHSPWSNHFDVTDINNLGPMYPDSFNLHPLFLYFSTTRYVFNKQGATVQPQNWDLLLYEALGW